MKENKAVQSIYDKMYRSSVEELYQGNNATDKWIERKNDSRRGLSLIIRPDKEVKTKINAFQKELQAVDPNQYYQPTSDLHVTVLSIIPCQAGLVLDHIDQSSYIKLINKSLSTAPPLELSFKGVTSSRDAMMIQGYSHQGNLNKYRNSLRKMLRKSTLKQDVDARYTLKTAHVTSIRFSRPLQNPEKYIQVFEHYQNVDFGNLHLSSLELVFNDWYHRRENTKVLKQFSV